MSFSRMNQSLLFMSFILYFGRNFGQLTRNFGRKFNPTVRSVSRISLRLSILAVMPYNFWIFFKNAWLKQVYQFKGRRPASNNQNSNFTKTHHHKIHTLPLSSNLFCCHCLVFGKSPSRHATASQNWSHVAAGEDVPFDWTTCSSISGALLLLSLLVLFLLRLGAKSQVWLRLHL